MIVDNCVKSIDEMFRAEKMAFQRWEDQVTKNQKKSLLDIDTNAKT